MASSAPVIEKKRKRKKKPARPQPQPKPKVKQVDTRPEVQVQQTAAAARRLAKEGDDTAALQMMAQAFEALDDAEGVEPWEPGTFLAWAQEQPRPVELMALFVVSLEDPRGVPFPMHDALLCWDELSRLAFSTWAIRAWWIEPETA